MITAITATVAVFASTAAGSGTVTLTIWENYGNSSKFVATQHLVAAFEKQHSNIKINVVPQPGSNFYALLKAASISHTGPDLAVLWSGVFVTQYQNLFLNIGPSLTAAQKSTVRGRNYLAPHFRAANGQYSVPLDFDSYVGFYNKALFKKAGITAVPTNWSELHAACTKLSAIGVTPMEYGLTGGLTLGAEFYPWFDFGYVMIGAGYSPVQWNDIYSGKIPWTSPRLVAQMDKWDALKSGGCTNSDVLTASNTIQSFNQGKAAMLVDGTFDTGVFEKGLGTNLGVFIPPYADGHIHGIQSMPGDGYGVTAWTKHKAEALQFEQFLTTTQAAKIIAAAGVPPNRKGFTGSDPVWSAIANFTSKQHFTVYPYSDNVLQPPVWDTGSKQLVAAFAGNISGLDALKSMKATLDSLPASQK